MVDNKDECETIDAACAGRSTFVPLISSVRRGRYHLSSAPLRHPHTYLGGHTRPSPGGSHNYWTQYHVLFHYAIMSSIMASVSVRVYGVGSVLFGSDIFDLCTGAATPERCGEWNTYTTIFILRIWTSSFIAKCVFGSSYILRTAWWLSFVRLRNSVVAVAL